LSKEFAWDTEFFSANSVDVRIVRPVAVCYRSGLRSVPGTETGEQPIGNIVCAIAHHSNLRAHPDHDFVVIDWSGLYQNEPPIGSDIIAPASG
jgi:hypothetical protein